MTSFISLIPKKIYILNLKNHNEEGSHWTLLHNGIYYDSYGMLPTLEISPFVKFYSEDDFQSLSQESCGYYCLYLADNIIANRPATQGLIPDHPRHNETVLKNYFSHPLNGSSAK